MDSTKDIGIGKFDGSDFSFWMMQIEDYLFSRKLHLPLGKQPEGMKDEEWKLLDRQVLGVVRLTLSKNVAHNVAKETTTAGLIKTLSDMYEQPTVNNKIYIYTQLVHMKMADDEPLADHLNKFNILINQLIAAEFEMTDDMVAVTFLASLPDSWSTMKTAIANSQGRSKLCFANIRDAALAEEIRLKSSGLTSNNGTALYFGRGKGNQSNNSKGKGTWNEGIECYYCHRKGHKKSDCRKLKQDQKDNGNNSEANMVAYALCSIDETFNIDEPMTDWVVDSASSFHMTSNKQLFSSFTSGDFGSVKLGNGNISKAAGIGDVSLKTDTGCRLLLRNVRYVPNYKLNIISAGQLDNAGYRSEFSRGVWKLTRGSLLVARGYKRSTLYVTRLNVVKVKGATRKVQIWRVVDVPSNGRGKPTAQKGQLDPNPSVHEKVQLGESGSAQKIASTERQDSELVKLPEGNRALLASFRVKEGVSIRDGISNLATGLNSNVKHMMKYFFTNVRWRRIVGKVVDPAT